MKKFIIWISIVLLILAGGAAAYYFTRQSGLKNNQWVCENGQWVKKGNPTEAPPSSGCGTQTPSFSASPSANPVSEKNVKVDSPAADSQVSLPITVKGSARVFENMVSFRIRENDGTVLYEGVQMANSPDVGQFGPFEKTIDFLTAKSKTADIVLDVFWNSPMDGSELDVVSVPLKIDLTKMSAVKAFFLPKDPGNDCGNVFGVERFVEKTSSIAKKSLEVLLQGITYKEADKGYATSIPGGVKLNKLNIVNGVAKADFSEELDKSIGGSCRVTSIRAQITQTLKQFPSVKDVVISINDNTEEILQP